MSRARISILLCLLCAGSAAAESKNPADYPLRLHIFTERQTTFYHWQVPEASRGDGRADLYADGSVQGVDFSFDCSQQLRASFGYETYPAKWKKPGRELTVLMPKFGQAGAYWTCELSTDLKPFAYTRHQGVMSSESIADFKAWMVRRDYDPEHGKETPTKDVPDPPAGQPTPPAH